MTLSQRCFTLAVLLTAIPAMAVAQTTASIPADDFDQTGKPWIGRVHTAALSSDGRCAAITTSSSVVVIDKTARELWRWDFSENNRFIIATNIVLAPKCDWLVFAGDVSYRYVWFVHRGGKRIPVKTEGTPLAVDIDPSGTLAAVGTGAGNIYLYTRDGTLRWKRADGGGIAPIDDLAFAPDGSAIMLRSRGHSVITIEGRTRWSGGVWGVGSGRAARDFKTFVAWGEPPHGPGIGTLALLDSAGKTLWSRYASNPVAIISSVGDLVIAQTNDNQNPTEEDGFSPRMEQQTRALRLLAADGSIVRTYSAKGDPIAFAADGNRFLIRTESAFVALDLEGTPLWSIPFSERYRTRILTTSDLRTVVTLANGSLAWYSPP